MTVRITFVSCYYPWGCTSRCVRGPQDTGEVASIHIYTVNSPSNLPSIHLDPINDPWPQSDKMRKEKNGKKKTKRKKKSKILGRKSEGRLGKRFEKGMVERLHARSPNTLNILETRAWFLWARMSVYWLFIFVYLFYSYTLSRSFFLFLWSLISFYIGGSARKDECVQRSGVGWSNLREVHEQNELWPRLVVVPTQLRASLNFHRMLLLFFSLFLFLSGYTSALFYSVKTNKTHEMNFPSRLNEIQRLAGDLSLERMKKKRVSVVIILSTCTPKLYILTNELSSVHNLGIWILKIKDIFLKVLNFLWERSFKILGSTFSKICAYFFFKPLNFIGNHWKVQKIIYS